MLSLFRHRAAEKLIIPMSSKYGERSFTSSGYRHYSSSNSSQIGRSNQGHGYRSYSDSNYRHSSNFQNRPAQNRRFYFRNVDYSRMSRSEVIEDIIKVEKHHIQTIWRNERSRKVEEVTWCPQYMEQGEHCTGGTQLPHHKCRSCNRVAIHLVDTKGRPCLRCYGWEHEDIPGWYYHKGCKHCAKRTK